MAFIRAKEIPPGSGNWYDYEVMNYREGDKVRQKVIRYIGRSMIGGGGGRGASESPTPEKPAAGRSPDTKPS
jgi:hypothetical protein